MYERNYTRQIVLTFAIIALVAITIFFSLGDILDLVRGKKAAEIENQSPQEEAANNQVAGTQGNLSIENLPGPLQLRFGLKNLQKTPLSYKKLIELTNQQRAEAGLNALTENIKLNESARKKVQDMFIKQYFEHKSPTGESVEQVIGSTGYVYIIVGENLALGDFPTEKSVIDAWMNSPSHRDNMLDSRYTEIGISAIEGEFKGERVWMAVQHFGLPMSVCPDIIDQKLKAQVEAETVSLNTLRADLERRQARIKSMNEYDPEYHREVEEYNKLAEEYNKRVPALKAKIDTYNKQVTSFNKCLDEKLGK